MRFAAGFLTATVLAALGFAGWNMYLNPLRNRVIATRPVGIFDSRSKTIVTLPAGTELFTVYSVTDPPADDYGSDALVRITIGDIREAAQLGLRPVPRHRREELPTLHLVASPPIGSGVRPN